MATPSYSRSLASSVKRLKLTPSTTIPTPSPLYQTRHVQTSAPRSAQPLPTNLERELATLRLPKAVQATYLAPLKHPRGTHPTESCDLYLSSYSVRNLEVFSDFAQRAAYFLKLPATGPKPLPRRTERWTVPKSNFVHKKSQENFERITMRRKIRIHNGHPETVAVWLAFLRKHQYYGVGMKANVFEYGTLDAAAADMDKEAETIEQMLGKVSLKIPGDGKGVKMLVAEPFKGSWGAYAPSSGAQSVPNSNKRILKERVGRS